MALSSSAWLSQSRNIVCGSTGAQGPTGPQGPQGNSTGLTFYYGITPTGATGTAAVTTGTMMTYPPPQPTNPNGTYPSVYGYYNQVVSTGQATGDLIARFQTPVGVPGVSTIPIGTWINSINAYSLITAAPDSPTGPTAFMYFESRLGLAPNTVFLSNKNRPTSITGGGIVEQVYLLEDTLQSAIAIPTPATNFIITDFYMIAPAGTIFQFWTNGDSISQVSTSLAPQSGTTGATGAPGSTGSTGATGATGPVGPQGSPGGQGPQGLPGNNGATGAPGATGANGTNGTNGTNGAPGTPIAGIDSVGRIAINGPYSYVPFVYQGVSLFVFGDIALSNSLRVGTDIQASGGIVAGIEGINTTGGLNVGQNINCVGQIAVGSNGIVSQGGITSAGSMRAVNFIVSSDRTIKENITEARKSYIDDLTKLRVVNYNYIDDSKKSKKLGFIAQDVEKIFPSIITEDKGVKGISYSALIPMLVSAIQSLKQEVDALKLLVNSTH